MFGAGLELRAMSMSELMHVPERARRLEVFTGAGRRRTWPADEKAAIVAESYAPGRTVCGVARRHGLPPAQLFTWRRLARRSRSRVPVQKPPVSCACSLVRPILKDEARRWKLIGTGHTDAWQLLRNRGRRI